MSRVAMAITVRMHGDFRSVEERVVAALKTQGFGVLTEIDVRETLKKKLDVDFKPYKILGACNLPLAYQALSLAPEVGLLLPCNVTLSQIEEGQIEVSLVDPLSMLGVITHPELEGVARAAREKLELVSKILKEEAA